jgi:hypothetical protein
MRTLDPLLKPPSTLTEIFRCTCLGKGSKNVLINILAISGDSKHFSFCSQKNMKNRPPGGQTGSPKFVSPQILCFLWVKTPCKISEPYINPFWEKNNMGRKKKKKKNAVKSGHLFAWQRTQAARANFTDIDSLSLEGQGSSFITLNLVAVQSLSVNLTTHWRKEKITKRNTKPTAFNSHCYSTESLSCTGQRLTRLPMLTKADPSS